MIDAHCHLFESEDPELEVTEFKARGGTEIICNGAGIESSKKAIEMAEKFPEVWATVGIHPEEAPRQISNINEQTSIQILNLTKHNKVVAVGECGLDYREDTTDEEKKWQKELFEFNINLANESKLPLVVHCRNAFDDMYTILKSQATSLNGIQLHCWTGNLEWAKKFVDLGCYLSFGGIITFKSSHELREVVKQTPQERILVETDAPYLAPEPIRGSRNTPANVMIVAETVARVRGQSIQVVDQFTTENARRLFRI